MRTFALAFAAPVCALAVAGCASDGYVEKVPFWTGWGYSQQRVDESTYLVRYDGQANANKEVVDAYWFYRCAELTRASGYEYFTANPPPPGFKPPTNSADPVRPQAFHPRARMSGRLLKVHGGAVYHYYYTPIYTGGGGTYTVWRSSGLVHMYHNPLPAYIRFAMNADIVMAQYKLFIDAKGKGQPPLRNDVIKAALIENPAYMGGMFNSPPAGSNPDTPLIAPPMPGAPPPLPPQPPAPSVYPPGAKRSPVVPETGSQAHLARGAAEPVRLAALTAI